MSTLTVAQIQVDIIVGDAKANLNKILPSIEAAAGMGAELVCLVRSSPTNRLDIPSGYRRPGPQPRLGGHCGGCEVVSVISYQCPHTSHVVQPKTAFS